MVKCVGDQVQVWQSSNALISEASRKTMPRKLDFGRRECAGNTDMWKCRLMTDLPYLAGCIAILMLALYL